MLEASGLALAYAKTPVIRDVDLRIDRGEFVALIGPNGAGKSALLRGLGRLLRPAAGTVTLDGTPLWSMAPRAAARRIAWVSTSPEVPADLTVVELLGRARYPYHGFFAGDARDSAVIAWALEACDIEAFAGRRVAALSAGERQRVSIAAGLAQEPDVLLLDEPTAFLDIQHALETLVLLARLNREQSLTIVLALHDLTQASRFAHRVVVLDRGRVVADGEPDAVLGAATLTPVFGVDLHVMSDPLTGRPILVPYLQPPAAGT